LIAKYLKGILGVKRRNEIRRILSGHITWNPYKDSKHIIASLYRNENKRGLGLLRLFIEVLSGPTLNQKIRQRKKHDRDPKLLILENKMKARNLAIELGIPVPKLYYATQNAETIPFDTLPNEYVIKTNHLSGMRIQINSLSGLNVMMIQNGKNLIDGKKYSNRELVLIFNEFLLQKWYPEEWAAFNIDPPMVMIEEMMLNKGNSTGTPPEDLKCYVFHGRAELFHVDFDRFGCFKRDFYSRSWERLEIEWEYPNSERSELKRPKDLEQIIAYAEGLASGLHFMRVDFLLTNRESVLGECTSYPGAGFERLSYWADKYYGWKWNHAEKK